MVEKYFGAILLTDEAEASISDEANYCTHGHAQAPPAQPSDERPAVQLRIN
jgi:hypothetical protein